MEGGGSVRAGEAGRLHRAPTSKAARLGYRRFAQAGDAVADLSGKCAERFNLADRDQAHTELVLRIDLEPIEARVVDLVARQVREVFPVEALALPRWIAEQDRL